MRIEEKGLKIKFEDVEAGQCFKSDFGAEAEVIPVNAKVVIE